MGEVIKVGIADWKICTGSDSVTTLGLGSCVGIAVWDTQLGIGGLAHIMLPDSTEIRNNATRPKFADTGIADMVEALIKAGAVKRRLNAKIAGGAQMFAFGNNNDMVRVGERNVLAVKKKLNELGIPIKAQDTGDSYGRTVVFTPSTGDFLIRAVGKPEKTI